MIYRGTTPTFSITLPETFPVSDITVAYLSFKQLGQKLFDKILSDMVVDQETNSLNVTLSQGNTLSFKDGYLKFQLRFVFEGEVWATEEWEETVKDVIKDGEI